MLANNSIHDGTEIPYHYIPAYGWGCVCVCIHSFKV